MVSGVMMEGRDIGCNSPVAKKPGLTESTIELKYLQSILGKQIGQRAKATPNFHWGDVKKNGSLLRPLKLHLVDGKRLYWMTMTTYRALNG